MATNCKAMLLSAVLLCLHSSEQSLHCWLPHSHFQLAFACMDASLYLDSCPGHHHNRPAHAEHW